MWEPCAPPEQTSRPWWSSEQADGSPMSVTSGFRGLGCRQKLGQSCTCKGCYVPGVKWGRPGAWASQVETCILIDVKGLWEEIRCFQLLFFPFIPPPAKRTCVTHRKDICFLGCAGFLKFFKFLSSLSYLALWQ